MSFDAQEFAAFLLRVGLSLDQIDRESLPSVSCGLCSKLLLAAWVVPASEPFTCRHSTVSTLNKAFRVVTS